MEIIEGQNINGIASLTIRLGCMSEIKMVLKSLKNHHNFLLSVKENFGDSECFYHELHQVESMILKIEDWL